MTIQQLQKDCFKNYKKSIGYPAEYRYFHGTPINVLVPIETELNKAMIVGAYPSAKFFTINGIIDTPVADNDAPFSDESYFDGSRVRSIPSGKELNEVILKQIGIERKECWITDLVKVFLFKDGHVNRYKKLGKNDIEENRSNFEEYAKKSMDWLEREIEICEPSVIILLGMEVTKVFFGLSDKVAKEYLNGEVKTKEIKGAERNIICLPHPGILMKKTKKNPWPDRFEKEIAIRAKKEIEKIKEAWR
jgi:uracil-DNA glycosylase